MKRDQSESNFHHIRLQLTSEQLIELYTWLHDKRRPTVSAIARAHGNDHPSEILHTTLLAHMLANLDTCKKPYVAVGEEMVIPVTQDRLEKLAFGGEFDMGTAKSSPTEHLPAVDTWENEGGPAAPEVHAPKSPPITLEVKAPVDFYQRGPDDEHEENAGETAELDEADTRALLDELHRNG